MATRLNRPQPRAKKPNTGLMTTVAILGLILILLPMAVGLYTDFLWFGEVDRDGGAGQRFHLEVYVAPEQVEGRVAAAVAAGGEVVDDSQAPGLTVIADPEGNRGVLCADMSAAPA